MISIMTDILYFPIHCLCEICHYSRETYDVFPLRVNFVIVTQNSQIGDAIYAILLHRICFRKTTYTERQMLVRNDKI